METSRLNQILRTSPLLARRGKRAASGPRPVRTGPGRVQRHLGLLASALLGIGLLPAVALVGPAAQAAPVGQGFTVTPSDLSFILKQVKIAEAHVRNTTSATGPCGALVGNGPNQIPSPLVSYGLRTVDGSCNNLIAGQERFGAADELFPRLTTPEFTNAEPVPVGFPGAGSPTTYQSKSGFVFDSEPRTVSNLIVDQTSSNPAAIAAAGFPVRAQGSGPPEVFPCTTEPTSYPFTISKAAGATSGSLTIQVTTPSGIVNVLSYSIP